MPNILVLRHVVGNEWHDETFPLGVDSIHSSSASVTIVPVNGA